MEGIDKYKDQIVSLPVTYVWRGHGSTIFIELGELSQDPSRNHPMGQFSLMLDCDWRIETNKEIICGSFSETNIIETEIEGLLKDSVSNICHTGVLPEIIVSLESGKRVLSFTSDAGQPEWTLFLPDRSWLCSKSGAVVNEKA